MCAEEAQLINKTIEVAAVCGFAVDNISLRHVISRVAADGRNGCIKDVPSNDAVLHALSTTI